MIVKRLLMLTASVGFFISCTAQIVSDSVITILEKVTVEKEIPGYKISRPSLSLKTRTPLLQLPQNIQVLSPALISDQQITDMADAVSRNVSGASSSVHEGWGNYVNLCMRGGRIIPFRNGMNVKMPWGPLTEDMCMIERIEFVKGPAGFMFANGDPAAMYNVVTKKPTGSDKGEVSFLTGSFDHYRTTIDLDGKLNKKGKVLYRFNMMAQAKKSHREFDYNNG
jgi:iron complex outermembrane receptor protein